MKSPKPRRPVSQTDVAPRLIDWSWYYAPATWFLLFMVALASYWNSFEGRLFFDDLSSVRGNPHIQVLANPYYWDEDRRWTKDGLIQAFGAEIDTPFAGRPMVSITFALNHWWASAEIPSEIPGDYSFLEPHAIYYHRVNFGFHFAVAVLLWHLLRRTFRAPNIKAYTGAHADLWATAAALIWIVHPINTETVVYVTQRTEQVVSFFLLLTIYCSSRSITGRFRAEWMTAATVFCALGMASKENMVAAPLLLVAYDRAFYFRTWRETFEKRWAAYLPIMATYVVLGYINSAIVAYRPDPSADGVLDVARRIVFHLMRVPAAVLPLVLLDRIVFFPTWRETFERRWSYYLTLFGSLLALGAVLDLQQSRFDPFETFGDDSWAAAFVDWVLRWNFLPMATVGGLAVLWDRALNYDTWREALQARWKYYVSAVGFFIAAHLTAETGPRGQSVGFGFERMGKWEYLITQCWCLSRYLRITLIPTGLCVDYGRLPILDLGHVVPGAVVVLSLLALTVWGWFKHPWVGFLGCWFFFILAPTSSFIPIVTEVGAERRMYLPVAAVLLGIGAVIAVLVQKYYLKDGRRLELSEVFVGATVVGCITVLFGVMSFLRNNDYLQDRTLYGHIAKTFPWNERGCNNFAKICIDEGRIEEAESLLNQALKIDPEYSDAFTNRGIIYHRRKQMDRAVQNATEALRWNPLNPSAWNNRGNAFLEMKLYDKAVEDFTQLVDMNPRGVEGYYGRANTYYLSGQLDKALEDINAVIERSPADFKAYNTRGNILKQQKKFREAIGSFTAGTEALYKAARSHHVESLDAVINVVQRGDLSQHQKAMQFGERKTLATIFGNRADAYRQLSEQDPNAKKQMFDDLLRAKWMDPENAVFALATAQQLYNDKKFQEAFAEFENVLRVQPNNADALWGRALSAHEIKNWDAMWQAVKVLRGMGANIDEALLRKWREESGRDIPQ